MRVYRLARAPYATLDGEGARRRGGRWTPPGKPAVYTSQHRSLALLEVVVHLDLTPELLPDDYVMLGIEIPDSVAVMLAPHHAPFPIAFDFPQVGLAWIEGGEAAVLSVPSVIVPEERNFIINPAHAAAAAIVISETVPFELDRRLRSQA